MTTMPKGQPRSVPDPEGELYDANMADLRRRREEAEAGRTKIARPSLAQSFIPVVGPAWEAVADYQDGNYAGAVFNIEQLFELATDAFRCRIKAGLGL